MSVETWIRIWRVGFWISIVGVLQFLLCCSLAMSAYPGGTMVDRNTAGYSMDQNYLSDLGRTFSFSGEPNTVASRLFGLSLIGLAIAIVPYFLFMPTHAADRIGWLRVASVFGGLSSCAMIAIAVTPTDQAVESHVCALVIWIVCILIVSSIHFLALFTSRESSFLWSFLSLGLAILMLFYARHGLAAAAAIWWGKRMPMDAVIMQKLVAVGCLVWFLIFSFRTAFARDLTPQAERILLREIVDQQAKDYLRKITSK